MTFDRSSHAVSQLVAIWGPAARLRGSFGHVPSESSLPLVHLPYRHFLILSGSDFQCHSNGVLHNSIEVLCGNLFRHFLVILLSNWTLYKLDTTMSYTSHTAMARLLKLFIRYNRALSIGTISHCRPKWLCTGVLVCQSVEKM